MTKTLRKAIMKGSESGIAKEGGWQLDQKPQMENANFLKIIL